MKIKFIPEANSVLIDDAASQQRQLINLMWGCNLVVGVLHSVDASLVNMTVIDYFFVALGVMAIAGLVYNNFYISSGNIYSVEEIKGIKSYSSFNKINYELLLKNGKKRKIHFGDDFESIKQLEVILNEK